MKSKSTPKKKLEGEGSYSGTRSYNAGLSEHVRSADIAGLAKKAARAIEGKEGPKLKKAEKAAKAGPKAARSNGHARGASAR
jgi:hypothetical protein